MTPPERAGFVLWARREVLATASAAALVGSPAAAQTKPPSAQPHSRNPKQDTMRRQIIDVHSHAILPVWLDALSKTTGLPRDKLVIGGTPLPAWSAEEHLAVMDKDGIATSILSMPSATAFLKGQPARDLARAMNEEFANIVARHPGRFGAFAVVPVDDMESAVGETSYALDVLKLDGLSAGTNTQGVYLGDSRFDPWFEEMNRRKATLFTHPSVPADNDKVNLGINVSIIEFMFDVTRMMTNMVFSGAKTRFADVAVIASHGGGAGPYLSNRIGVLEEMYGAGAGRPKLTYEEVLDGLGSFYFDLTAATSAAQLSAILHVTPSSRLMLGMDYPFMPEWTIKPAVERLDQYSALSAQQREDIDRGTAARLFPRFANAKVA